MENTNMEKKVAYGAGWPMIIIQFIILAIGSWMLIPQFTTDIPTNGYGGPFSDTDYHFWPILLFILFCITNLIFFFGAYVVNDPNQEAIVTFMGKYKGTIKENGFFFLHPFYGVQKISTRVTNHATKVIKVNDKNGVPIELGATIVYRVQDTYKANFDVENLAQFIDNQFEVALREVGKTHTYSQLTTEDQDFAQDAASRVERGGVEVLEGKITHLTYSSEIASVMLQKQQAQAMSEARKIIVTNAVEIAKEAATHVPNMTEAEKAKFVANLTIVICSDRGVTPTMSV